MSENSTILKDMVVVVTGAAQGIGRAYAMALAGAGASVAICDISDPSAVVAELKSKGCRCLGSRVDISRADQIECFIDEVESELGPIGGLVNNAAIFGTLRPKPYDSIDDEEFRRVMDVNVTGVFLTTRAAARVMRPRKFGRIVNISSSTVLGGTPGFLHYVVSKGAVLTMTRVFARELGPHGIAVNTVVPGLVSSENVRANEALANLIEGSAQRRVFQREQLPEDLTGPVIFFLSASSAFVTGQSLIVDGGVYFG